MSLIDHVVRAGLLSLDLRHFVCRRRREQRRQPHTLENRIGPGQQTPAEKQFRMRPTAGAYPIRADILRLFFDAWWHGS